MHPETRTVTFVCNSAQAAKAQQVFVAGTFNEWLNPREGRIQPDPLYELEEVDDGQGTVWRRSLEIPVGPHEFKFVIGDSYWVHWEADSCYDKGSEAPGGANYRILAE